MRREGCMAVPARVGRGRRILSDGLPLEERPLQLHGFRAHNLGVPASHAYDVIVIGVGGMGSAALYHLARRGKRVLGIERFAIPNEMGSSHGVTRVIRLPYHNHLSYV